MIDHMIQQGAKVKNHAERHVKLLAAVLAVLGVVGFAPAAQGAVTHEYLAAPSEEISKGVPEGQPVPGQLTGFFNSMTVAPGHHLWISEYTYSDQLRVDEFDAYTGAFESQLAQSPSAAITGMGIAVGESTGEREVYAAGRPNNISVVAVFGPLGTLQNVWDGADTPYGWFTPPPKPLFESTGEVRGVAVDESSDPGDWAQHDVYVSTSVAGTTVRSVVDVFKPKAGGGEEYLTQLDGTCATGTMCEPSLAFTAPASVTVDQVNGDLLVVDRDGDGDGGVDGAVDVFEPVPGMEKVYKFLFRITEGPNGPLRRIGQIAVDGATGSIYIPESTTGTELGSIDEFRFAPDGEAAEYEGHLEGTPTEPLGSISGLAVDQESGDVYAENFRSNGVTSVDVFGPDLVIPDVVSLPPSAVTPRSATLNGTVNPLDEGAAKCVFEWGTTTELGQTAKCEPEEVEGDTPAAVHSQMLEGLAPDTTYYYRLQATNEHTNKSNVDTGGILHFTTSGPGISEEATSYVTSTAATLDGAINPNKAATSYHFEYDTIEYSSSASHGVSVPVPNVPIGSGETAVELTPEHITGLTPGTVYHFRVVALSEVEPGRPVAFDGPDETFTTQTTYTSVLPDGRRWEMVSPPNKDGALIAPIGQEGLIQAAAGGDAITYHTNQPTEPDPAGYSNQMQLLSTRGPGGWSTKDIALPHPTETDGGEGQGEDYRFFSEDLSLAVAQPFGAFVPSSSPQALAPGEASEQTAFLRTLYRNGNVGEPCLQSCYRPLVTGALGYANVPPGTPFGEEGNCPAPQGTCGPQAVDASPDGTHVVVESAAALTSPSGGNLYEWSAGRLSPVSLLPKGEGPSPGNVGGGQSGVGDLRHAVSNNGSRVFWEHESASIRNSYMRDLEREETLALGSADFEDANAEGSRVFLGGAVCEVKLNQAAKELECETTSLGGPVLGISEDGSYVYDMSENILTTSENGEHEKATAGAPNLYMHHYGGEPGKGGWEAPRFIATLSREDEPDWDVTTISGMTARVSPNGQWLAFMSDKKLTDYDNLDAVSGKPDEEVYLYDAAASRLACASCNPSGARPVGEEYGNLGSGSVVGGDDVWEGSTWLAANVPGWTPYVHGGALYQSRYLSNSGRLFFNSHDPLVPQDVNGNWDVYEYDPVETGDCTPASATFDSGSNGCVGLISSGESDEESGFLDASETGGDVFFLTTAELVSQDYDKAFDVYDAHECTSASPCTPLPRVSPPECTTADACRVAPNPQPSIYGAPSSETFSGLGNFTPGPATVTSKKTTKAGQCKKGSVKKKGRCVKKARKRSRAKRSARGRK
jgi:hypothetical protein